MVRLADEWFSLLGLRPGADVPRAFLFSPTKEHPTMGGMKRTWKKRLRSYGRVMNR
jgi:hypothetical protein